MLFFYIRHGDPIYDPDSLTPLGERQAEAVGKRLAMYGLNKIYSSTSNRAKLTAKPACEILKKEPELLDFANESHAWRELTLERPDRNDRRDWLFQSKAGIEILTSPEVRALGYKWYEHESIKQYDFGKGINRIYDKADEFFASLGYEHERYGGRYRITKHTNDRVALFAHAGFGLAFLSCILDIPYPLFAMSFDMTHTGMTVINFEDRGEYTSPRILTYSNDAHLYREGIMAGYNNGIRF